MALALFIAKHAIVLAAILLAAAGMGTLAAGARFDLPLRSALGLMVWGQALFLLALFGQLRVMPILVLTFVAIVGGALRGFPSPGAARHPVPADAWRGGTGIALFAGLFLLALHPPLAFDETLYHLPFVRTLAQSGQLRVLQDMRFPVFPRLHELLCVPLFLLAGDVATHLVSLAEVLITAALLLEWGRRYEAPAGSLAAALFLGSPIVLHLATIGYVDAALTLFVTAGFYCLDRARSEPRGWLALSGLFFGTACSVKYLGGYFAVVALIFVLLRSRGALMFAACCLAAALPTTLWLTVTTHNPLFPFLPQLFGSTAWSISPAAVAPATRVVRTLRLIWDVTFARERVNFQPPVTPLLAAIVIVVAAAALRDVRARGVLFVRAGYLAVFAFLPQDSRYLVPLLPLLSIAAAAAVVARWPKFGRCLAWIAIAPGVLYVGYRLALLGMPPSTPAEREASLARRVPGYSAVIHANEGRIYVCGGEQLKYYARGELLGDVIGPHSYQRVLGGAGSTAQIAERLRRIDANWFLVVRRVCAPRPDGGMDLVYEDAAAQLWRVQGTHSAP